MTTDVIATQQEELLPQPLGEFQPVDAWQGHVSQLFYDLKGGQVREYYQTFASADYRLAYALAEDYYVRALEREKKQAKRAELSASPRVLTIHEWGCGNGNLAACFLDRLKTLDKEGILYPRVHYVLIDTVDEILKSAKANPDLVKHQDQLTITCASVEDLQAFEDGTVDRIVCNELWSELPTKLLLKKSGELLEEHLRPNVSEKRLAEIADWSGCIQAFTERDVEALKGLPNLLEDLVWEREYHKVESKELPFRKTIAEFLKGIDDEILVPVNLGACATIKEAKRLLASDAMGFSSFDVGTADQMVLNDADKPCYAIHGGQFSFIVNFALLSEVATHLGVHGVMVEPQKEFIGRSLGTNVMSLMDLLASHPKLPKNEPWEIDALILNTIRVINQSYRSPYERTIEFPIRPETPSEQRETLEALLQSMKRDGIPDTIAYLTEEEVFGNITELEALGYEREVIQAAFMVPPQSVDYSHFFFPA